MTCSSFVANGLFHISGGSSAPCLDGFHPPLLLLPPCSVSRMLLDGQQPWDFRLALPERHFRETEGGKGSWGMYVPWLHLLSVSAVCPCPLPRHSPAGGPSPPASAPPPGSSSRPLQPRRGRKTPRVLHCPVGFSLNPAYTFTNTSVMGNLMLST